MAEHKTGELLSGRYRILASLGEGGFAKTYRAEDTHKSNTVCVVKELLEFGVGGASLRTPENIRLFEREGKILQRLEQRGPFPYHLASPPGELVHVMEYIPGRTLDTLLTTSLDIPAVLSLLKEILEVVAVLHAQQVIHRDITPRNLIRYAATGAERETRWRTTGQLFQQ